MNNFVTGALKSTITGFSNLRNTKSKVGDGVKNHSNDKSLRSDRKGLNRLFNLLQVIKNIRSNKVVPIRPLAESSAKGLFSSFQKYNADDASVISTASTVKISNSKNGFDPVKAKNKTYNPAQYQSLLLNDDVALEIGIKASLDDFKLSGFHDDRNYRQYEGNPFISSGDVLSDTLDDFEKKVGKDSNRPSDSDQLNPVKLRFAGAEWDRPEGFISPFSEEGKREASKQSPVFIDPVEVGEQHDNPEAKKYRQLWEGNPFEESSDIIDGHLHHGIPGLKKDSEQSSTFKFAGVEWQKPDGFISPFSEEGKKEALQHNPKTLHYVDKSK